MSVFDMKILSGIGLLACAAIAAWVYVQREYRTYLDIARA